MHRNTVLLSLLAAAVVHAAPGTMAFTVSMPQRATHTLHVRFRCEGLKGEVQDFKMPAWSPGYYGIGEYARDVSNFRAADGRDMHCNLKGRRGIRGAW
jgi:predicted metalloprotease with PDZ domain